MKISTLIAAAALATASTAAIAQDVTTTDGEVVVIEKNQAPAAGLAGSTAALGGTVAFLAIAVAVAVASGSDPSGGT